MSNKLLTPRQVMYRLEKYEENEQKLKEYKDSIKLELNRLRKVESRYKQHINDHSKLRSPDVKNFKDESNIKHHRHDVVFTIPNDINEEYVLVYNVENTSLKTLVENLNIRCCVFKVDELSSDDIINNKLIILDDNSSLLNQFVQINKTRINKTIKYKHINTINELNELRLLITNVINEQA